MASPLIRSRFIAARLAPSSRFSCRAVSASASRTMTTFTDREKGEEAVYMRREDKKLLDDILKKAKAEESGPTTARTELMEILGDHELPDNVIDKIVAWKKS